MPDNPLEELIEHLRRDVDDSVVPIIVDYDWDEDTVRTEDSLRVTIWLQRGDAND